MKKGLKITLIALAVIAYTVALFFAFRALVIKGNAKVEDIETVVKSAKTEAIELDLKKANLNVKEGKEFKVVTNSKYITVNETKTRLSIKERRHSIFALDEDTEVTVYIPASLKIKNFGIETEEGSINVTSLTVKKLILEAGINDVNFDYLRVEELAKIEAGEGKLTVSSGTIYNLDLEASTGKVELTSKLKGESEIEVGVGNVNVNLLKSARHYEIKYSAGAGKATVNGEKLKDGKTFGSGEYKLSIEGGVGNIKIATA